MATGLALLESNHNHAIRIPQYNNLTDYGVCKDDYESLLRMEIRRLVKVAKSGDPSAIPQGLFGTTTADSYKQISALASKAVNDCETTTLDNLVLTLETFQSSHAVKDCAPNFKRAYSHLKLEYFSSEGQKPEEYPLEPPEKYRELYFQLVDVILDTMARFLVRLVALDKWNKTAISLLATLAVKLKFLFGSTKEHARHAVNRADGLLSWYAELEPEVQVIKIYEADDRSGTVESKAVQMKEVDIDDASHALNYLRFHGMLMDCFRGVLGSMINPSSSVHGFNSFHQHAVVYETGFERTPVLLANQRVGLSTSSNPQHLEIFSRALHIVKENIDAIQKHRTPPTSTSPTEIADKCSISLYMEKRIPDGTVKMEKTSFDTSEIADVIYVLIPLSFITTWNAEHLESMFHGAILVSDEEEDKAFQRLECPQFLARCSVQTHAHRTSEKKHRQPDTLPLSECSRIGSYQGEKTLKIIFHKYEMLTDIWWANLWIMIRIALVRR